MKTVAVLMGGPSTEHEVSLHSGAVVLEELDSARYVGVPVIISRTGLWSFPSRGVHEVELYEALRLVTEEVDVVFIAVHGAWGEDGVLQGLFEVAGIPYTGSGVVASALASNKVLCSSLCAAAQMPTPHTWSVGRGAYDPARTWPLPCVVKPCSGGSSIGVTIVQEEAQLSGAFQRVFETDPVAVLQELIEGVEVTCGVIERAGEVIALPPTEIVPKTGTFFDYEAKYVKGASEEITPARLGVEVITHVQKLAVQAHTLIGARGMSRTDFIIRENIPYFLEINTIPGLTRTSLLPQAAAAQGISMRDLISLIIEGNS